MVKFVPAKGYMEVTPILKDSMLPSSDNIKGWAKVISVGKGITDYKPGEVVAFMAWGLDQSEEYQGKVVNTLDVKAIVGKYGHKK